MDEVDGILEAAVLSGKKCAGGDEGLSTFAGASADGAMDWHLTISIRSRRVIAVAEQGFEKLDIALTGNPVQGCLAVDVTLIDRWARRI